MTKICVAQRSKIYAQAPIVRPTSARQNFATMDAIDFRRR